MSHAVSERSVARLIKIRGELDHQFAEAIQLVRSAVTALENGDRAEASRLLTAAADIECDLTGDTLATGDLFAVLGLDDLAEDAP